MAFAFRLGAIAIFVTALLHLSAATSNSSGCTKNEFWYNESKCCLPIGGPKTPTLPPSQDDDCPPTRHYWSKERACCVPRHSSPPNSPVPQCRNGWTWVPSLRKCTRNPSKPTKPPPMPSPKPGVHTKGFGHQNKRHGLVGHANRKRSRARSDALCPHGLDACPIGGLKSDDYECIDAYADLEYCGGCTRTGDGTDCTAIPGVWNVGCEVGRCVVYTCVRGYAPSLDGSTCELI